MTQAELEAEIESLRGEVLQLQRQQEQLQKQQEGQKKHWFRWGLIAGCIGFVLSIVIIALMAVAGPTPPIMTILFSALQLYVLCLAFASAGRPPEGPIRSVLKWGWS
jgi:Flp pilus assembly protein TadB